MRIVSFCDIFMLRFISFCVEIADGELYKQIFHDILSINEGMLFENAVAQSLAAKEYKLFFYTHHNEEKHRNDMEIDFTLSNGSKLKPKIYPRAFNAVFTFCSRRG